MKKFKRTVAGISALLFALSLTACGGGNDSGSGSSGGNAGGNDAGGGGEAATEATTTETTTAAPQETEAFALESEEIEKASGALEMLTDEELENKVIKCLCHWDPNPEEGKTTPVALGLFQEKYGGMIQWYPTTWEQRYSDLSTYVLGGEGIDFFQRDEESLPKGVVNGMFQAVDDYIDLDGPLWKDMKAAMDAYNFNGKHYAFATSVSAENIVYYNTQTIEENGFDDPWELYEEGKWDYDTFTKMLEEFVDNENTYGLDGWWSELALYRTGGVPLIEAKNGEIVINMDSPEIEKAQNFMLELYNKGLVIDKSVFDWAENPQFMGEGKELFFICGPWHVMNPPANWSSQIPAENLGIVPLPHAPGATETWQGVTVDGWVLCKGAANPQGVGYYMDCGRAAALDDGSKEVDRDKQRNDFQWSDDIIERMEKINEEARKYPVIDIAGGISADVESLTTSNQNKSVGLNAALHGVDWATTREELREALAVYVGEVADKLKEMS